ncbi:MULTISPECIES: Gfo/Idh/MocA family protein [Lactobacillaceae]|jgi:myo-inositol 2-dehydrogenase/D-chiro-inositol 1-dehydrogenase|nr:Gfo/Idh/MocA family oxidoreductase [Oenococcus oeni]
MFVFTIFQDDCTLKRLHNGGILIVKSKTNTVQEGIIMTLSIGIIGLGFMGSDHVKRVATRLNGARLGGVADLKKDLAEKYAKEYGAKVFDNGMDLIDSPDIDAVMVVTRPHETHEKFVIHAIEVGKFVFCEKPLTLTAAGCQKIIDAEVKGGKRLVQVGFMRRYDPGYIEMKKAIDSHEYGEPLLIHATHRNTAVDESYDTSMSIIETAIHEADVLHWLLGEDYDSGTTFLPKKQTKYTHSKLHDPQIITLDTKSGVHIDLEVFVNDQIGYDINCSVVCEDGIIDLESPQVTSVKTNKLKRQTKIPVDCTERFKVAYDHELQNWVNDVAQNKVTGPSSWDGLVAMVTCDALAKSRDNNAERVAIKLPDNKPALYND